MYMIVWIIKIIDYTKSLIGTVLLIISGAWPGIILVYARNAFISIYILMSICL